MPHGLVGIQHDHGDRHDADYGDLRREPDTIGQHQHGNDGGERRRLQHEKQRNAKPFDPVFSPVARPSSTPMTAEMVTPMIIGTMVMPSARGKRPSRIISQPASAVAESDGNALLTGSRPAYSQAASTITKDATVKAVER